MQLRQYQTEARDAILKEWRNGNKRTLLVLPTGTGKTIVFAKVTEEVVRDGGRVLILAHRGELLDQASDKIFQLTRLKCALEKAESTCFDDWYRIVVGSVQTLMRPQRLAKFPPDYFDAIIVDEAHHALADSYQRVLKHFENACVLGVTATPDRGDMRELGQYFQSLAYEYSLPRAIRDGFLCRILAQTIPLEIDLTKVSVTAGDFEAGELGNALDPYLRTIAAEMRALCQGRKTVVFLPLIKTSQRMCDLLEEQGFRAVEVNGVSRDRKEILHDFDAGKYDVLCNSMLLTEGWDCPSVDCIVCLRPTKIRSLYCQIIGRGTRIHPGKANLLLLDFLWLSSRHELVRPAHLIAETPDVARKMTQLLNTGEAISIEDVLEEAEELALHEREESLMHKLDEMKKRKRKLVDPLQFELSIQEESLADYVPAFAWELAKPTDLQKQTLEKRGIYADEIEHAGKAQRLIDTLDKRAGLATPKQIRFLEQRGFQHVGTWPFDSAKRMIDRIAANGWRTPIGMNVNGYKPKETT
jgi:superfamily II DNA or RNA helicase